MNRRERELGISAEIFKIYQDEQKALSPESSLRLSVAIAAGLQFLHALLVLSMMQRRC
jgi:hypothetical protein